MIENFRREDGWFSHWSREHVWHDKVFADTPFITGLIYTGWDLLGELDTNKIRKFKNGYHARKRPELPGGLIRDLEMTGPDHLKMLNRDQWSTLYPIAYELKTSIRVHEFELWRDFAKFRPRHWLMPNHSLHFKRVEGDPSGFHKWIGDRLEYVGVLGHEPGDEDGTIHKTVRLSWAILKTEPSRIILRSWKVLNHVVDVKADFTEFATRPIPGDPPGDHPRLDWVWHRVIDRVNERVGK